MTSRKMMASTIGAVALSATVALPALAGAPTYTGTLTCTFSHSGETGQLLWGDDWTKKSLAEARRHWETSGFCEKGSVDTRTGFVKNG